MPDGGNHPCRYPDTLLCHGFSCVWRFTSVLVVPSRELRTLVRFWTLLHFSGDHCIGLTILRRSRGVLYGPVNGRNITHRIGRRLFTKLNGLVSIVNRMTPILESHGIGQEGPFISDDITLDRIGCRTFQSHCMRRQGIIEGRR